MFDNLDKDTANIYIAGPINNAAFTDLNAFCGNALNIAEKLIKTPAAATAPPRALTRLVNLISESFLRALLNTVRPIAKPVKVIRVETASSIPCDFGNDSTILNKIANEPNVTNAFAIPEPSTSDSILIDPANIPKDTAILRIFVDFDGCLSFAIAVPILLKLVVRDLAVFPTFSAASPIWFITLRIVAKPKIKPAAAICSGLML